MIEHTMKQDSDCTTSEWKEIRRGKATSSNFSQILTPAKLQFSKSSRSYAIELAAERLGIASEPKLPSFEMEEGTAKEPYARAAYAKRHNVEVRELGFIEPSADAMYGFSPDGLIGDDGLLEIKCPKVETLIGYHLDGKFPMAYSSQIQGQLWISQRKWCDLFVWHEEIEPFEFRVEPDLAWQEAMEAAMPAFLKMVEGIELLIKKQPEEAWDE